MDSDLTDHLYVFVLAGGSGERFWPMSRIQTPKHLLKLLSERTLLEETIQRLQGVVSDTKTFVLTNESQLEACRAALPNFPAAQVIAEPAKRDTAPAAALATAIARARDPEAICVLLPADAMIHDTATFQKNLRDGVRVAQEHNALLTFSIPPTRPATGFGYLELGNSLEAGPEGSLVCEVKRFVEKPGIELAETYFEGGRHGWNAGMFIWSAKLFLQECAANQPELAAFIHEFPGRDFAEYVAKKFPHLPKISVDYAIMEKAQRVIAVKAEFDWDDVGTWTALPKHLGADSRENTTRGATTLIDARNNVVISNGRTIALCGVSDLVVVETGDAILVCHRDAVERIKQLQPHLPEAVR